MKQSVAWHVNYFGYFYHVYVDGFSSKYVKTIGVGSGGFVKS